MSNELTTFRRPLSWLLKLTAWGFFCIAMVCFLLVGLMIWKGGVWAYIIYAENPIGHFLGGAGALFAWYFLIYGIHNTAKEWAVFSAKVLLLTISLAVSLVAGEVILRKFYSMRQDANSMERFKAARKNGKPIPIRSTHPLATIVQPSDNQMLVYELQPNLDTEFGHKRVRTNTDGMREDRDYPVEPPAGTIRIVGIGDSGMFGWDVEQGEDYMGALETRLNARKDGTSYEVLNLGVPGYNTQLEVEMLRYRGLKYKPSIVIVGWCENDFSLPYFMIEKENYRKWDKSYLYILMFKRCTNRTEVAPGFTVRDMRGYDTNSVMPELTAGTDPEGVKKVMIELLELSREKGFKVLFFGPMKETIIRLCKKLGMPYLCTYDVIPDNKYPAEYMLFYMHPRKEGHSILAEYLEEDLVKRGWIQPPVKPQD